MIVGRSVNSEKLVSVSISKVFGGKVMHFCCGQDEGDGLKAVTICKLNK